MRSATHTDLCPVIGIHLDLKYQMPLKSYLLEWIERLPGLGINTLLLEYEDKFPFQRYPFLQQEGAFTTDELTAVLRSARGAGLRIIPLVQTLSHLEFALAHEELASLREMPDTPTQICPSNPSAVAFVHELLDEVLSYHEEDEWIHIGADEAWALGTCPECADRVDESGSMSLWLEHTSDMCAYVSDKGKRPIVWDDVFWKDPDRIRDFPADAIICPWHYNITSLKPDGTAARCAEAYRAAGRDFLGIPCVNWGVLFPQHHCLDNTQALVELAKTRDGLGVINSAWSCFHLPLPAFSMGIAATGALMTADIDAITNTWEQTFLDDEFGIHIEGLPTALATLGEIWEVWIEGLSRPITPPTHGCMDMVLHYEGGHAERMRRGAYPLDWTTVDFPALFRRKLDLLRTLPPDHDFFSDLDRFLSAYGSAAEIVSGLAEKATRRREEAKLLGAMADLKLQATRALKLLIRECGQEQGILAALTACRGPLEEGLGNFLEPVSVRRLVGMWYEPLASALRSLERPN